MSKKFKTSAWGQIITDPRTLSNEEHVANYGYDGAKEFKEDVEYYEFINAPVQVED